MFLELTFLGTVAYKGAALVAQRLRGAPLRGHQPPRGPVRRTPARGADIEDDHDHRFTVSTVNLGVSAAALAFPALTPLAAGGVLYVGAPVFTRGVTGLIRDGKIGNDLLVTLSMATFIATGYVGIMAIGAWFYFLGSRVQQRAKVRAQLRLSELFMQAPRDVWMLKDGLEVAIPLEQLQKGDVIVVRTGEIVPIDGVITRGQGLLDQHLLTGESQPAEKDVGDEVLASTVVLAGTLHVRAEQTGRDTTTARIAAVLEQAVDHKSSIQLKGEAWADQAALPLLATAGVALVFFGPVPSGLVLSSGIGNRMRLLGPLGTLRYLNVAFNFGFLVKDGRALEQLRSIDTVLFDKTGTLTKNEMVIRRVVPVGRYGEREIVWHAAIAESRQGHPIARTILRRAAELGLDLPEVDSGRYQIGYGITVEHDGRLVQVGSANFLRREGLPLAAADRVEREAHEEGHALVLVAIDGAIAGAIELEAALRPDLPEMLGLLRRHGVTNIAIVSGDHEQPTRMLASRLGVDGCYAGLSAEGKAEIVDRLRREGRKVCFIGDGVNDSVAMKKADVSMSLQGASSFAIDAAQIVLLDADVGLANLGRLFDLARGLDRNLRNSLKIVVAFAAINVNGALFVEDFSVLTAYGIKQLGLAAGLGNAMMVPEGRTHAKKKRE